MVETEVTQSLKPSEKDEDESIDANGPTENLITKDDEEYIDPRILEKERAEEAIKAARLAKAKKGLSITRSLITFGFDSWVSFEPGKQKE